VDESIVASLDLAGGRCLASVTLGAGAKRRTMLAALERGG
jgi:hypothetical protein